MTYARSFSDLLVWQKARTLYVEIYKITSNFPPEEKYELTRQMRRSAVSVLLPTLPRASEDAGKKKKCISIILHLLLWKNCEPKQF
ncbi:MAG: four helix bundle protein [Candidatus Gracilibacteria bacterium]|nr:four helix bundle protein [Candidatus Gracilibacteria bacterium]